MTHNTAKYFTTLQNSLPAPLSLFLSHTHTLHPPHFRNTSSRENLAFQETHTYTAITFDSPHVNHTRENSRSLFFSLSRKHARRERFICFPSTHARQVLVLPHTHASEPFYFPYTKFTISGHVKPGEKRRSGGICLRARRGPFFTSGPRKVVARGEEDWIPECGGFGAGELFGRCRCIYIVIGTNRLLWGGE